MLKLMIKFTYLCTQYTYNAHAYLIRLLEDLYHEYQEKEKKI